MKLSHDKVKQCAMATHDVAPMPPIDSKNHCHHAVMLIASIANSFFCGCRGDATGRRVAPSAVLVVVLLLSSMITMNPAFSQTPDAIQVHDTHSVESTSKEAKQVNGSWQKYQTATKDTSSEYDTIEGNGTVEGNDTLLPGDKLSPDKLPSSDKPPSGDTASDAEPGDASSSSTYVDQDTSLQGTAQMDAAYEDDMKRVKAFSRFLPPNIRDAIIQSRKANRNGPLMVFRRWQQERKPFVPTFLFCMFVGLLGSAFFPKHVAVAQECCRSQFWKCLGRAILVGITVLTAVIILGKLHIAHQLSMLLLALLELALVAGLSVGVSLIGEGLTRGNLAKSEHFKTHPRVATFIKISIGSLILALIVQIPGAGLLPRIGIRIAVLVAILGAGGLLKTKFGTQPTSTE